MKKFIFFTAYVFLILSIVQAEQTNEKVDSPRLSFINEAYKYLKTPYKYAGASSTGMDCSGLIYRSALDSVNKPLPRRASEIATYAKRIDNAEIQPGDLVFFVTYGEKISHVGIYIGEGEFIHSASAGPRTGVIISALSEKYWKKCYRFAGRILPKEDIFSEQN